jgi:hypothetical protein
MHKIVLAILLTISTACVAGAEDSQVSDKLLHAIGGAGISTGVGYSTGRPWLGLTAGCGAGVGKEIHDHVVSHESFAGNARDVAITCSAATVGYFVVKKMIRSNHHRGPEKAAIGR